MEDVELKLENILRRLSRLERIITERQTSKARSKVSEDPKQAPSPEGTMLSGDVREMCGGISEMTLWRWQEDPELNFPRPVRVIRKRKHWRRADVEAWIASQ